MACGEKSVTWVTAALIVAIAAVGWGFLAGSYTGAHAATISEMTGDGLEEFDSPGTVQLRRVAERNFVSNAIDQLPNMSAVIGWNFRNRIWLPLTFVVLEVVAIVLGVKMKLLERELRKPYRSKR